MKIKLTLAEKYLNKRKILSRGRKKRSAGFFIFVQNDGRAVIKPNGSFPRDSQVSLGMTNVEIRKKSDFLFAV